MSQERSGHSSDRLLLRILASADYFTTDPVLSKEGLLVDVEISTTLTDAFMN